MRIPTIIHQTWKTSELPKGIDSCVASIREASPGWQYMLHTDDMWPACIEAQNVIAPRDFNLIPTGIQKSDVFRMAALHAWGGVYSDVDMLAVRPISEIFDAAQRWGFLKSDTEVILTTDHPIHARALYGSQEVAMNNFIVAAPKADFTRIYLEEISESLRHSKMGREPVSTTGPMFMTEVIQKHGGLDRLKIAVLPYFWINPLPDLSLDFPERVAFREMVKSGSWVQNFCPFLVHCWWHSYWDSANCTYLEGLLELGLRNSQAQQTINFVRPTKDSLSFWEAEGSGRADSRV